MCRLSGLPQSQGRPSPSSREPNMHHALAVGDRRRAYLPAHRRPPRARTPSALAAPEQQQGLEESRGAGACTVRTPRATGSPGCTMAEPADHTPGHGGYHVCLIMKHPDSFSFCLPHLPNLGSFQPSFLVMIFSLSFSFWDRGGTNRSPCYGGTGT